MFPLNSICNVAFVCNVLTVYSSLFSLIYSFVCCLLVVVGRLVPLKCADVNERLQACAVCDDDEDEDDDDEAHSRV